MTHGRRTFPWMALSCASLLVGCGGSAEPVVDTGHTDSDTDTHGDDDDDHTHGTGTVDVHIHGLAFWRSTKEIIIGTHEGTHRTEAAGGELTELASEGDFMGFVHDPYNPDTYWGSGHFAAGGFGNWGFIESTDGGMTWSEISLSGDVDFHSMAVGSDQENTVAGAFAGDLYFSDDAGRSWSNWPGVGSPTGMEIESATGPVMLVASEAGISRITAPAMTTERLVDGDTTGLDRVGDGYAYGKANGNIKICDTNLENCVTIEGPNTDGMHHLLQDPDNEDHLYVLTWASQVFHSEDLGATWELVIDGV